MNSSPKVSVGMPVYNGERWLRATIDSILGQTYQDFELIISDNASTDKTEEICRAYAAVDKRIRYYRNQTNIGIAKNYNILLSYARGEYFKWASGNDICKPEFVEKCVEILDDREDVVLSYPRTRLFNEDSGLLKDYHDNMNLQDEKPCIRFIKYLQRVGLNNAMNGLIRTTILKKTGLNKDHFSTDINMTAELSLYGKFCEIPDYLFYRRMDEKTVTSLKSRTEATRNFHPNLEKLMLFQCWKLYYEYYAAVCRVPIPLTEKLCVMRYLLKRTVWARLQLARDIKEAVCVFPQILKKKFRFSA
jgi:glycosyltransferase involved in cell wall biosynthesis